MFNGSSSSYFCSRCGVVYDAWMFPLSEEVYGKVDQPVLFVNSETFHWKSNIEKIYQMMGEGMIAFLPN